MDAPGWLSSFQSESMLEVIRKTTTIGDDLTGISEIIASLLLYVVQASLIANAVVSRLDIEDNLAPRELLSGIMHLRRLGIDPPEGALGLNKRAAGIQGLASIEDERYRVRANGRT
jgi:hypothetical protein